MRVIAGKARRVQLKVPRGWKGRPTLDRVREALFNIMAVEVVGSRFLDLYAGTGSVGIEALSRGARQAFFVEKDERAINALRQNLEITGLMAQAVILPFDVRQALPYLKRRGEKFDIIFLDPPYEKEMEKPTLEQIDRLTLLASGGIVVVESSKRVLLPPEVGTLILGRQEKYGDTLLSFYRLQQLAVKE